ncbi:MAG TPA: hypothetical protein PK808_04820 [Polymorphobacter sp.]|nr:hypothetical protein [Polymorphobacter sp.]
MTEVTDSPPAAMPEWFHAELHIRTDNGVYERATGFFLADDGLPHAGMARCRRLAAAGVDEDPLGMVDAVSIATTAALLRDEAAKTAEAEAAAFVAEKQANITKGARRTGERLASNAGDAGSGAATAQED